MNGGIFIRRLARDERGVEAVEIALGVALFAVIAGLGFMALGGAIELLFESAGGDRFLVDDLG